MVSLFAIHLTSHVVYLVQYFPTFPVLFFSSPQKNILSSYISHLLRKKKFFQKYCLRINKSFALFTWSIFKFSRDADVCLKF